MECACFERRCGDHDLHGHCDTGRRDLQLSYHVLHRHRSHQRYELHVHRAGHEHEWSWYVEHRVERGGAIDGVERPDRCDRDRRPERTGTGGMVCTRLDRRCGDLLVHCDGIAWWCNLHDLDNSMHRHRSHQRYELHVHRDSDERERYEYSEHCIGVSDAVRAAGRPYSSDSDEWAERPGSTVVDCAGVERRERDHLVHCDGFTWWCNLHDSYHVVHRHRAYERHCVHLHRDGDERVRGRFFECCVELCDAFHDTRYAEWRVGDERSERAGSSIVDCAGVERFSDHLVSGDCIPWWRYLQLSYDVMHRHRSHQRYELHLHRASHERRRSRRNEHRFQCCDSVRATWNTDDLRHNTRLHRRHRDIMGRPQRHRRRDERLCHLRVRRDLHLLDRWCDPERHERNIDSSSLRPHRTRHLHLHSHQHKRWRYVCGVRCERELPRVGNTSTTCCDLRVRDLSTITETRCERHWRVSWRAARHERECHLHLLERRSDPLVLVDHKPWFSP